MSHRLRIRYQIKQRYVVQQLVSNPSTVHGCPGFAKPLIVDGEKEEIAALLWGLCVVNAHLPALL